MGVKRTKSLKRCKGCDTPKEAGKFYQQSNTCDGLSSRCKVCRKKQHAAYDAANPRKRLWTERMREAQRKRRQGG